MAYSKEIPVLTTQQMVEVDRLMIEEFQIELIQMMENAGRNFAELARRELDGRVGGKSIAVLCGAGNNGGGGLVAARHLHNWGAAVNVNLAYDPSRLKDIPSRQLRILEQMDLDINKQPEIFDVALILDALIGYGLSGDPRQPISGWIEKANRAGTPILALDAPSGLDITSGIPRNPCIAAAATLTLALPKVGLLTEEAKEKVGDLYLADVSVPPELYQRLGLDVPNLFEKDSILKIN